MRIDSPSPAHTGQLWELWEEAFGDSEAFFRLFLATGYSPRRCRCALDGDRVAAAAYWFDCSCCGKKLAYVYAVATRKAYRGRGLCRQLMGHIHAVLEEEGYCGALLVPGSPELFRMYEKLGYRTCAFLDTLEAVAENVPCSLRQISPGEYGILRRQLLPENAVVQEGGNLAFLGGQAALYAGDGFLLAAAEDDGHLTAVELLPSADRAGAILNALGCETGSFRVPGSTRPFAMYHPLGENAPPPPAYFGLAFD